MVIYLLRHAPSTRSKIGIWGRLYNADLDNEYLFKMNESKTKLALIARENVFSSPLNRCIQTATFVLGKSTPINIINEFKAYHSGYFEDKTEDFIKNKYPEYLKQSFKERFCIPKYNEESIVQQTHRVLYGLKKTFSMHLSGDIIVSTHFSVINIIANFINENFDYDSYAEGNFNISEGDFLKLEFDKNEVLTNLNSNTSEP